MCVCVCVCVCVRVSGVRARVRSCTSVCRVCVRAFVRVSVM